MLKIKNQKSKIKIANQNSKILNFALSFCILIFGFCNFCYAQDKIIAIVNNDVITQRDLDDFVSFTRVQLSRDFKGLALETKIQSIKLDLLDRLIEDRLILQEAKKYNINIDENRIKARIDEIKRHYNSDAEFQDDLAKQGLVQADIESKTRDQFLMYTIVDFKVRSKIIINPEEVTSFYNKNIKEFLSGEERQLEAITLENEDLAKTFSYNLRTGQKLVDLAARYPITVNKLKAVAGTGELRKDIEGVVFKLGIGEVSNPVKIDNKYYIFKLENIIPSRQQSLSEVQDKIHDFLFESKMQEGLTKWLDELKKQSYIKIMQD